MVVLKEAYDIKKTLGRNAARVFLYHAELDFSRKLQICQEKVNSIAYNQLRDGDAKRDDRDFLILNWSVIQVVNSLADYARALREYYKDEPGEYTSNVLHKNIIKVQEITQLIGGMNQTETDLTLFHGQIISDLVEKAINNYSQNSWTSLNNLVTALYLADKLGFNHLPVVIRAYNNIINKLPELRVPLKIKASPK